METIKTAYPGAKVDLWAEDEHRMGLISIARQVWARRGQRPIARQKTEYKWLYVYGFVQPETGRSEWYLMNTVNIEAFSKALGDFAKEHQANAHHHILLVLDRAGYHHSKRVNVPEGIHLIPLPAYSPELQPAERLWPLVNESVANQAFPSLDELDDRVSRRCCSLANQKELLKSYTLFHWWPKNLGSMTA